MVHYYMLHTLVIDMDFQQSWHPNAMMVRINQYIASERGTSQPVFQYCRDKLPARYQSIAVISLSVCNLPPRLPTMDRQPLDFFLAPFFCCLERIWNQLRI